MTTTLRIHATGRPITQGSKTKTRWGMRDANGDKLHPWRDTVTAAAIDAIGDAPPIEGPVNVTMVFAFARPAGHYGTGRNATVLKPSAPSHPISLRMGDLDKLCRAVCDSLTGARVWLDDSQVANMAAAKEWCGRGEREGVTIHVVPLGSVDVRPAAGAQGVA